VSRARVRVLAVEMTGAAVERIDGRLRVGMMALRARFLRVELHRVQRPLRLLVTAHAVPAAILALGPEAVTAHAVGERRIGSRRVALHGVLHPRLRLMALGAGRVIARSEAVLHVVARLTRDALLPNVHDVPRSVAILAPCCRNGRARRRWHRPLAHAQRPPARGACTDDGRGRSCEQRDPQTGAHGSPTWHRRQGSSLARLFE
jgi:hypothetical protein